VAAPATAAGAVAPVEEHHHDYRQALQRTFMAVGAAGVFALGLWYANGPNSAMEFVTGYLIEESLSIDNIFVFIMLFEYFKVGRLEP
jgi:tellurite resistance protein TerC